MVVVIVARSCRGAGDCIITRKGRRQALETLEGLHFGSKSCRAKYVMTYKAKALKIAPINFFQELLPVLIKVSLPGSINENAKEMGSEELLVSQPSI